MLIEQSKTDPFVVALPSPSMQLVHLATSPIRALRLYMEANTPSQSNSPVFKGGRFSPLDRQHLTISIRHLSQNTCYNYQHYASHSFRSGTATTAAAAAGVPDCLIKSLGRWRGMLTKDTYILPQQCYSQYQHF